MKAGSHREEGEARHPLQEAEHGSPPTEAPALSPRSRRTDVAPGFLPDRGLRAAFRRPSTWLAFGVLIALQIVRLIRQRLTNFKGQSCSASQGLSRPTSGSFWN
jgi:hypothetical protein